MLISGISRGIGKELALSFSRNGWNVCGCYKNNKPEYMIPNSKFIKADISKYEEVKEFIKSSITDYSKIDCVINNASITMSSTIFKMTEDIWESVIRTNLNGTFYMLKEALSAMIKQKSGSIINIASISAFKSCIGDSNLFSFKIGRYISYKNSRERRRAFRDNC